MAPFNPFAGICARRGCVNSWLICLIWRGKQPCPVAFCGGEPFSTLLCSLRLVVAVFALIAQPVLAAQLRLSDSGAGLERAGAFFRFQSLWMPMVCPRFPDLCPLVDQRVDFLSAVAPFSVRSSSPSPRDRNGVPAVQVTDSRGRWVQRELIERGWARFASDGESAADRRVLQQAEQAARAGQRGLWATAFGRVKSAQNPSELWPFLNSEQIVAGTLYRASLRGEWLYLNFGPDWRHDFTLALHHNDLVRQEWPEVIRDLYRRKNDGAGLFLEARGQVVRWNGPAMIITDPGQLSLSQTLNGLDEEAVLTAGQKDRLSD